MYYTIIKNEIYKSIYVTFLHLRICFCIQKSTWHRLRKSINGLSNHRLSIKTHDISKHDVVFGKYPITARYLQHRKNFTNGGWICLTASIHSDHPIIIILFHFGKNKASPTTRTMVKNWNNFRTI